MKTNLIKEKSFAFALKVIKICESMRNESKEFVLSKQLLRSGTAVGALVRESEHAESRADFIHKLAVALKEANETQYWLELISASGYMEKSKSIDSLAEISEILRILVAIIKTTKSKTLASKTP
jgi:four helix bundle protein